MDCKFAEKISLLIDGELSPGETATVTEHLAVCAECRTTEKDFLFLREQIRESIPEFTAPENLPAPIFPDKNPGPVWQRKISIPVPVFGLVVLAMIGLSVWFLIIRGYQKTSATAVQPVAKTDPPNQTSLAKYDRGGRAEIYVIKPEGK